MVRKRQLLVMHDAAARLQSVTTLLEQAGYAVETAADQAAARAILGRNRTEVAVLAAPAGIDLCRTLKTAPVAARVPIVLIAPGDPAGLRPQGLAAGADEMIAWPLAQEAFLDLILQLLEIRDVAQALDVGVAPVVDALERNHG